MLSYLNLKICIMLIWLYLITCVAIWHMWMYNTYRDMTRVGVWRMWMYDACRCVTHVEMWRLWMYDVCRDVTPVDVWRLWMYNTCRDVTPVDIWRVEMTRVDVWHVWMYDTCWDMQVSTRPHTHTGTQTLWTQLCAALSQAHPTCGGGGGPGWKPNELDPSFLKIFIYILVRKDFLV